MPYYSVDMGWRLTPSELTPDGKKEQLVRF